MPTNELQAHLNAIVDKYGASSGLGRGDIEKLPAVQVRDFCAAMADKLRGSSADATLYEGYTEGLTEGLRVLAQSGNESPTMSELLRFKPAGSESAASESRQRKERPQ